MSDESKRFIDACLPALQYLLNRHEPYLKIIISEEGIELVSTIHGAPINCIRPCLKVTELDK